MILGQDELIKTINNLNLDTFPQSLLLLGDEGCGKHTLCNYIANSLKLDLIELNNRIDDEIIENILAKPYPIIYFIDIDNILPKFQNNLLKLIEEPQIGKYFILLSKNINNILPTLLNRCKIWKFKPYTRSILNIFANTSDPNSNILLNIASTPGQVLKLKDYSLDEMVNLSYNIINRLHISSLPNVLTISDKIAFKDEKEKLNLDIFLKVFKYVLLETIKNNNEPRYIKMYNKLIEVINNLNFTLSKQKTFEHFLLELQEAAKC